ncbi:MAG: toll/interleukin-1 receptor domain-containing protein [Balneolaceae bacterium]
MSKIFISYSHNDEKWRSELETHLSLLKRQGLISTWHDRRIVGGDDFANEIDVNINDSNIILLLVSPYFISSDYCYEKEMDRALERHKGKEARVIPIILEHCDWQTAPFGKLLALPQDGKPITTFLNPHEALTGIAKEIRGIIESEEKDYSEKQKIIVSKTSVQKPKEKKPIRSSNLTVKKKFSEKEIDDFLEESYNYIYKFFANSLEELKNRNDFIDYKLDKIDSRHFTVKLFKYNEKENECMIWYSPDDSFSFGINYSNSISQGNSGFNESLRPNNNGRYLYLEAYNMFNPMLNKDEYYFKESAAEYYWGYFIRPLQQ